MKKIIVIAVAALFSAALSYAGTTPTAGTGSGTTVAPVTPSGTPTAKKPGKVAKRQARQIKRIKQGVKSGELTKGETKTLVEDQKNIQTEKQDMKASNGGTLSTEDKETLNKEQNQESDKIYDLKHNDRTAK
ncbi:MAG: hypothetical protein ABSA34_00790 [Candidatus Goldiibacteriota bacterium]